MRISIIAQYNHACPSKYRWCMCCLFVLGVFVLACAGQTGRCIWCSGESAASRLRHCQCQVQCRLHLTTYLSHRYKYKYKNKNKQIHTPDTGNVKFNAYCNSSSIQLKIVYTNTNTQSHLVLENPPLTLANSSSMQLSPPYSLTTCLSTCRPISMAHCNEIHLFLAISARRDRFLHKKVGSEEGWHWPGCIAIY